MKLFEEILIQALIEGKVQVSFGGADCTVTALVEGRCYQVLEKIKAIIQDDSLDDAECFARIEKIICALEEIGSDGGFRHDFG